MDGGRAPAARPASECTPDSGRAPARARYAGGVRHSFSAVIALAAATSLLPGCLSNSYTIPRQELRALAQSDPHTRGQRVRVVQNFVTQEQPPATPPVYSHTTVVVYSGSAPAPPPRLRGGGSGASGGKAQTQAKLEAEDAAYWVIVAGLVAVGLAVTEGARFDGWAELHPMHPVHLYGRNGEYAWVPLAQLTPETAGWARQAVVVEDQGPWRPLERAPLDRQGWTYSVLLGTSEVPLASGDTTRGFLSHIQLGHFFTRELGVLLDIGLGWATDPLGNTVFDSRNALELEYLPVAVGRLHGGVFGELGLGRRFDDSPAGSDLYGTVLGGGALLQLELTTRLAITGRAGIAMAYGETISDLTVGLSIY